MVDSILLAGKAEGRNPLRALKEIGKLIRFKDYQFLKTGEELPNVVKSLLGEEKNLKAVVGSTTAEMISAMANKRAADIISAVVLPTTAFKFFSSPSKLLTTFGNSSPVFKN